MTGRRWAALIATLLILASALLIYHRFSQERDLHSTEVAALEIAFVTKDAGGTEVVDADILRYSDMTYLDMSINITNSGEHDLRIRNPVLTLNLEGILIEEKELQDLTLPAKTSDSIRLEDLSVKTETINEALKRMLERSPSESVDLNAGLSIEYPFQIGNITLFSYRIPASFNGKILLREIFGGKTQKKAAEEILKLQ